MRWWKLEVEYENESDYIGYLKGNQILRGIALTSINNSNLQTLSDVIQSLMALEINLYTTVLSISAIIFLFSIKTFVDPLVKRVTPLPVPYDLFLVRSKWSSYMISFGSVNNRYCYLYNLWLQHYTQHENHRQDSDWVRNTVFSRDRYDDINRISDVFLPTLFKSLFPRAIRLHHFFFKEKL